MTNKTIEVCVPKYSRSDKLGLILSQDDGDAILVHSIAASSLFAATELKVGMQVVRVCGVSATGMSFGQAMRLMREAEEVVEIQAKLHKRGTIPLEICTQPPPPLEIPVVPATVTPTKLDLMDDDASQGSDQSPSMISFLPSTLLPASPRPDPDGSRLNLSGSESSGKFLYSSESGESDSENSEDFSDREGMDDSGGTGTSRRSSSGNLSHDSRTTLQAGNKAPSRVKVRAKKGAKSPVGLNLVASKDGGVKIEEMEANSIFQNTQLLAGMVIVSINGKDCAAPYSVKQAERLLRSGRRSRVTIEAVPEVVDPPKPKSIYGGVPAANFGEGSLIQSSIPEGSPSVIGGGGSLAMSCVDDFSQFDYSLDPEAGLGPKTAKKGKDNATLASNQYHDPSVSDITIDEHLLRAHMASGSMLYEEKTDIDIERMAPVLPNIIQPDDDDSDTYNSPPLEQQQKPKASPPQTPTTVDTGGSMISNSLISEAKTCTFSLDDSPLPLALISGGSNDDQVECYEEKSAKEIAQDMANEDSLRFQNLYKSKEFTAPAPQQRGGSFLDVPQAEEFSPFYDPPMEDAEFVPNSFCSEATGVMGNQRPKPLLGKSQAELEEEYEEKSLTISQICRNASVQEEVKQVPKRPQRIAVSFEGLPSNNPPPGVAPGGHWGSGQEKKKGGCLALLFFGCGRGPVQELYRDPKGRVYDVNGKKLGSEASTKFQHSIRDETTLRDFSMNDSNSIENRTVFSF